jgi:hypothetical protein
MIIWNEKKNEYVEHRDGIDRKKENDGKNYACGAQTIQIKAAENQFQQY